MKITVDADRMHSMAAEIRTTVDTLRYNMDTMEILVHSLNGEWQAMQNVPLPARSCMFEESLKRWSSSLQSMLHYWSVLQKNTFVMKMKWQQK